MSASFLASLIAYFFIGFYAILITSVQFTPDPVVRWWVFGVIMLVAIYYYYTAAYVELDQEVHESLEQATIWEWRIRVIALSVLFLLWFVLQVFGWKWFTRLLVFQYLIYLLWDFIVRKRLPKSKELILLDLLGLVPSLMLLFFIGQPSLRTHLWLGIATTLYLVLVILGIILIKFKPIVYMMRPLAR